MPEVQGKKATDIEFRVAVSLSKYNWSYEFQASFSGGREVLGGQVVDFVVNTLPLPTPMWLQGEYFHPDSVIDRDRMNRNLLYSQLHGRYGIPVVIWGVDLQTQEESDSIILKTFGRN